MIKYDELKLKNSLKFSIFPLGLLCVFLSPYTLLFIITALIVKVSKKACRVFNIFCVLLSIVCLVWIRLSYHEVLDFFKLFLHYNKTFFVIDNPVRLNIAALYGLYFSFFSHLLNQDMSNWVVEKKIKEQENLIKPGKFNYRNLTHLFIGGSSGSGKGVALNHIIKECFRTNKKLIVISAKLAKMDKFSQLAYCKRMAKLTNRKLYIVSMDESVSDRYQYNPFKYLSKIEMQNALNSMIETDSYYYSTNFSMWVLSIYKAIKACKKTVSMNNILDLYDYDDYEMFLTDQKRKGICSEEAFKYLTSNKIKRYAETAKNDAANLQLICESCESVFKPTDNNKKITIRDAFAENAVIYFDLNGTSAEAATMLLGSCILAEIQHVISEFSDEDDLKTVIADEASFYMSPLFKACFNESRSAGYQFIISTQGPSDISGNQKEKANKLFLQISNNCGQFGFLHMNSNEDSQIAADIIGTTKIAETTHRAMSIDYDETGSIKAVDAYLANPNTIRNLDKLEMIYCEKVNDGSHISKPVMIRWRVDDL